MKSNFHRGLLIAIAGIMLFFIPSVRDFSFMLASFGLGLMFSDLKKQEKKEW